MDVNLRSDEFEQSITRRYRARLWSRFIKAIREFDLIKPNDKICVCISGGKDSMVLAKLFQQLKKHSEFSFDVEYVVMNPGYNPRNLELIKHNLEKLKIPAQIFETNIFEVAYNQTRSPCFLCAKMRRGALYNIAKNLGCNKIALGHHFDDVIETTLMNMLNVGSFQTMLPKLHSTNFEGMELIRPLYFIRERDIVSWRKFHNLEFLQCACRLTEETKVDESASQRLQTKLLIKQLLSYNSQVEMNIYRATENVNLDMLLGYKKGGEKHSYLEEYENDKLTNE